MKIIMYYADFSGCGFYRILQPAKYLKKHFDLETSHSINPNNKADIRVFQRQAEMSINHAIKLKEDCKIIYENDDDLFNLSPLNGAYTFWNPRRNVLIEYAQLCDAITVSTEPLKKVYQDITKNNNVEVIPNAIDFSMMKDRKKNKSIVIGFAGSGSHWIDLELIMPAILNILRKNKNVIFHSIGFDGIVKNYGNIYKHLPFGQYKQTSFIDKIQDYYDAIDFDIGLIPNVDIKFNESKSNVKYLEYSAKGVATIASNIIPFRNTINPVTGFLTKTKGSIVADWQKKIQRLIDDTQLRLSIQNNSYNFVKENYNILDVVNDYVNFYDGIIK